MPGWPLGGVGNFIGGVTKVNPPSQVGTVSGSVYAGTVEPPTLFRLLPHGWTLLNSRAILPINQPMDRYHCHCACARYSILFGCDFNTVATVSSAALSTPLATAFTNGAYWFILINTPLSGNGKLDVADGTLNSNSPSIILKMLMLYMWTPPRIQTVVDGTK